MKLVSINPSSNEILGEVEVSTQEEITSKVKSAHEAKVYWRNLGIEGRNKILRDYRGGSCLADHEEKGA